MTHKNCGPPSRRPADRSEVSASDSADIITETKGNTRSAFDPVAGAVVLHQWNPPAKARRVIDPCPNDLPEKLAARIAVDPESGCWVAAGPRDRNGYARIGDQGLHRVVYTMLAGPIPPGLVLDHVKARGCIWNCCVNPAHLEPVTTRTNILRGTSFAAVNFAKTNCGRCGEPYDLINCYVWHGRRDCRACIRRRTREYKQRQLQTDLARAA
jgi:hypothetical protein